MKNKEKMWTFIFFALPAIVILGLHFSYSGIITKPNTFSDGDTISAGEFNENFDTLFNDYNGSITNANISASAGITASKLSLTSITDNVSINTTGGPVLRLNNGSSTQPILTLLDNGTTSFIYLDGGIIGMNIETSTNIKATHGGIDIASGGIGLVLGADESATTRTTGTTKISKIGFPHVDNSSAPVTFIFGSAGSVNNSLSFGGGASGMNAATSISFYTALTTTTVIGSERVNITKEGFIHLRPVGTADAVLEVSSGAVTGGGSVHAASYASHSSEKLKKIFRTLNGVDNASAYNDLVSMPIKEWCYDQETLPNGESRKSPVCLGPRKFGPTFETAPDRIKDFGAETISLEDRISLLEQALQHAAKKIEDLERR
jgi:hypothetical protein